MDPLTSPTSDATDLSRWIEERDEAAMARLIQRHGPAVLGLCRRLLRDASDAEDAAQATFIALSQHAGRLREGARVAAWLHRTAVRTSVRLRRSQGRRRRVERLAGELQPAPLPMTEVVDSRLDEALAALSEAERALLLAHHGAGMPVAAIAAADGVPVETVKKRLQRARDHLATWYRRRGGYLPSTIVVASSPVTPQALALWSRVACHPAAHAAPRALALSLQAGRTVRGMAHLAHISAGIGLASAGILILRHAGGHPPRPPFPQVTEMVLPSLSCLLALIGLVGVEQVWWWRRTRETQWAPLLLLGVVTLGTVLTMLFLLLRLPLWRLWHVGTPISFGAWMCLIAVLSFPVAGTVWVTDAGRPRQPLPSVAVLVRGLLLGAMLAAAWWNVGRWLVA